MSCVPWGRFDWALARASFAPEFSQAFFLWWILEREREEGIDIEGGRNLDGRWCLMSGGRQRGAMHNGPIEPIMTPRLVRPLNKSTRGAREKLTY